MTVPYNLHLWMGSSMERDVLELFGRMVVLRNNIVSMIGSMLGGCIAAHGILVNVYRKFWSNVRKRSEKMPYQWTQYPSNPFPTIQSHWMPDFSKLPRNHLAIQVFYLWASFGSYFYSITSINWKLVVCIEHCFNQLCTTQQSRMRVQGFHRL